MRHTICVKRIQNRITGNDKMLKPRKVAYVKMDIKVMDMFVLISMNVIQITKILTMLCLHLLQNAMKPLIALIQMAHLHVAVLLVGWVMDFFAMILMNVFRDLTTATQVGNQTYFLIKQSNILLIFSIDAICVNNNGSYTCECEDGFSGRGRGPNGCTDMDECQTIDHTCSIYAVCHNDHGLYDCECFTGFIGDGFNCIDVDECTLGLHQCPLHSHCVNNEGSYICKCDAGYQKTQSVNGVCEEGKKQLMD